MNDFEGVLSEARKAAAETVARCFSDNITNCMLMETRINEVLEKFILKNSGLSL